MLCVRKWTRARLRRLVPTVVAAVLLASGISVAGVTATPEKAKADVSAPSWWNGKTCDTDNYPGSYPLGASFNGVIACGPGTYNQGGTDHLERFYSGAWGEYEWECVELVMRYMYLVYGVAPYSAPGGKDVVNNYSGSALTKVSNDGTSLPSPGDIISFDGTTSNPYGHTAVVTGYNYSGSTIISLEVMQQNATSNGWGSVAVSGNKVTGTDLGGGVSAWLHGPSSSPAPTFPDDLATNGGFTNGTANWTAYGNTYFLVQNSTDTAGTQPYEGSMPFAVTQTVSSGGSFYQAIPMTITAGNTYCMSAEVTTDGTGSGAGGAMVMFLTGTNPQESAQANFSNLPGNNVWTPVQTCMTATSSHTGMTIQFYPTVGPPSAPFLDVAVVNVNQSLAVNGGFTNGTANWTAYGNTYFLTSNTTDAAGTSPYEGSMPFAVTQTVSSGGSIYQYIPMTITAGNTYCMSAEVTTDGTGSGAGGSMVMFLNGTNPQESAQANFSNLPGNNVWTPVQTCMTATSSHTGITVQFYPTVGPPTAPFLDVAVVNVNQNLATNGGFTNGTTNWSVYGNTYFLVQNSTDSAGTAPYEGSMPFAVTQTVSSGGSFYQVISMPITAGNTYCISAEVTTDGTGSGAGGVMAMFLTGTNPQESSQADFSSLPGNNVWTPIQTCMTATSSHTGITVQVYPTDGPPTAPFLDVAVVNVT